MGRLAAVNGLRRYHCAAAQEKLVTDVVIRDAGNQAMAFVYSRDNPDEARQTKVLTADEARLPELLEREPR
jgi:hypothetical protein